MSERFWKNLSTVLGWMSIGVLFSLVTFSSSLEIKDLDLWLHLRMGWWISHYAFVPNVDVLSCTIAGKPWVNHEWLFQVLVYQVQHAFGFDGLISMQSFVVAFTFLMLLFLGYSRERQWLTIPVLLMVLTVYQSRFTIRPDIFSLLFFVMYIYILSLHINKRWAIYALVILQVLWSNMHGFFFFGPLLVLVALLSEFLKRRCPLPYEWNSIGRISDSEYFSLKMILPFVMLACCVNPLTLKGAWYPISVFFRLAGDNKIFFDHILELQKPITAKTIFTENYLYYKILIIISALSFVFNRRKIDISSLLVWIIFLGFSLAAIRNLVYFATAAYMVIMVNAISITWDNLVPLRFTSFKFKYLTGIIFTLCVIMWMLNAGLQMMNNGYFDFDTYTRKSEFFGISKRSYPYKAVNFLVHEKIKGNFFNDFNSGAYLVGRAYPNVKVFIDGRTEEYGAQFFKNYLRIWKDGNSKVFEAYEKKYNITGAFLNNSHFQQIPPLALKMFHSYKDWSIIYLDYDAVIFLKQVPLNKPFIDKFAIDINHWKPKPLDLVKIDTKPIDPFPFTNRAFILEALGADEGAMAECREALRIAPDYAPAFDMLGKIYLKHKDYNKAFENYRVGVMYSSDSLSRVGLAQSLENLKEYHEAINQYQRVLNASPKQAEAYFGLAQTYAEDGQDKKSLDMLDQARKLGLEDKVDVQKIHDIINNKKIKINLPSSIIKKGQATKQSFSKRK